MRVQQRQRRRLADSLNIAALVLASFTLAPAPVTAAGIDPTTTGSIGPAGTQSSVSAAFRKALTLIEKGDHAQAYQLARGIDDTVERRTIQWAAIQYGDGDVDYRSVKRFEADAPHFASASLYRTRIEQALTQSDPGTAEIISLLGGQMPNTIDAQMMLASAYVEDGQIARAGRIARHIWVSNFLSREQEEEVLSRFGNLLTNQDHWDRSVHLLMHDRARGVERIMDKLTAAQKSLALARIAVARKQANAQDLIDRVDPSLRDHYLFHFNRGQFALDNGNFSGAVAMFDQQKSGNVPDGALFWYAREKIARQALAAGNYQLSYAAAAPYTDGPEGRVVDAQFHAGWVALIWLNNPQAAKTHFENMKALSTLAGSISQSNYWLGRTYEALGASDAARASYQVAAAYGDQFYGQMAREKLGQKLVQLRALPEWRSVEAGFEQRELVRAVRLLNSQGKGVWAEPLVRTLAYSLDNGGELMLAARLAQDIKAHHLAIIIADLSDRRGTPLDLFHFPKDGLPGTTKLAKIDNAAIYAVARQESRFDLDAVSHAGARGLMQLMPGTAKETAGKVGLAYSPTRLVTDAEYNALLGSTYLGYQLDRYDGSLLLAAAAYNAGAGNVNKWLKRFGDPRSSSVDTVNWIELIPFGETRNYVQKVMANYVVYRARLGDDSMTLARALQSIPH